MNHPDFNWRIFIIDSIDGDSPNYSLFNLTTLLLGDALLRVMSEWDDEDDSLFTFGSSAGGDLILVFNPATLPSP